MPVSLRVRYPCRRFRPRITEGGLFLVCFCVLASGTKAQTMPSREYIRLGTRVIDIEVPTPTAAAPTFSPAGGNYNAPQTVTITTTTPGATIRYTLDGSTPSETNGTAGTSVTISSTATLMAIAYKNEDTNGVLPANPAARRPAHRDLPWQDSVHSRPRQGTRRHRTNDGRSRTLGLPATILVSRASFALADGQRKRIGPERHPWGPLQVTGKK